MGIKTNYLILLLMAGAFVASKANSADLESEIDALLEPLLSQDVVSGAVLVSGADGILVAKGFGLANRDHNIPNSIDTRFRIASMSKSLTSVAVMQLVEQGVLELDGEIGGFFPETVAWQNITIRQLLEHSSGIPSTPFIKDFFKKSVSEHTLQQSIEWIVEEPLRFEPGERFEYSNSGYILLSRIIEIVSAMDYETYMQRRVFAPIGMKDSGLDSWTRISRGRATGYSRMANGEFGRANSRNPSECFGCGALYSTVYDLHRLLRSVRDAEIVNPESRDLMWKPSRETPWGDQYGLGWFVGESHGRQMIASRGGTSGFMSVMQYFPNDDITVISLLNQDFMLHTQLFERLAAIALREPWEALLTTTGEIPREHPLRKYSGRYRMDDGAIVAISADGPFLFYEEEGQTGRVKIRPMSDNVGYVVEYNARLSFREDHDEDSVHLNALFGVLLWRGTRISE